MFDPEAAIQEALASTDQSSLRKLQEEEMAKLRKPTRGGAKRTFGIRAVSLALESLEHLDPNNPDDTKRIHFEYERLAEGYALLGNLESAIHYSTDRVAEYQQMLDAIHKPDDEWCACPSSRQQSSNKMIPTNGRFVVTTIPYKNRDYTLYKCNNCGFVNAS